jgi:tetratricopeptide (TPR) repeat protein
MGDLVSITKLGPRRGMRRAVPARAWYDRGCAVEAVDPVGARVAYERALAGRPDFADAHCNLGRLHHDAGELAAAETSYRLAICASPEVALYWFNLGVVLEDLGRCAEAIKAYEHALQLEPTLADAHFNLARQYEQVGRRGADDLVMRRAVRHLKRYRDLVRTLG